MRNDDDTLDASVAARARRDRRRDAIRATRLRRRRAQACGLVALAGTAGLAVATWFAGRC